MSGACKNLFYICGGHGDHKVFCKLVRAAFACLPSESTHRVSLEDFKYEDYQCSH